MNSTIRLVVYAALILLLPLALLALPHVPRQPVPAPRDATSAPPSSAAPARLGTRTRWTLADARATLQRQPDDPYLQFVVLQLAAGQYRLADVRDDLPLFASSAAGLLRSPIGLWLRANEAQARLQAGTVLGLAEKSSSTAPESGSAVAIAQLHGPALPGRSWPKLVAGRRPAVSLLSRSVPDDFYLAEFRALDRLAAVLDAGRAWLNCLCVQAEQSATTAPVRARLQRQLAFDFDDKALVPLTGAIAVTGSDPFLVEGSDVTVLVQLRPEAIEAFRTRVEQSMSVAAGQPGAGRTQDSYRGVGYGYIATADRAISAYAVTLPDKRVHIRSNSPVALKRVLDTVLDDKAPSVGASDEYAHVRTLLPIGAAEEDGLMVVPEALRRRLVGPALQITEARRRVGYNHLRMIAYAAQLYRTQTGKAPRSLADLVEAGCAPGPFNEGLLASPFGGTYTLTADGTAGMCSVLGSADNLRPCCELSIAGASAEEAAAYGAFVQDFHAKHRLWLAPVAVRLQTGPRQVRAEALLMPPHDDPVHKRLDLLLGSAPEPLEPLPVPALSAASISVRIDKDRWLAQNGAMQSALGTAAPADVKAFLERGIGNQAALHLYDVAVPYGLSVPAVVAQVLKTAGSPEQSPLGALGTLPAALACPAYVALPVKESAVVDRFLVQLDAALAREAPTWRTRRLGLPVQGEFYHFTSKTGFAMRALGVRAGPVRYRLFWARLGAGLYVANQPGILDDVQTATAQQRPARPGDHGPVAHALVKFRPGEWTQLLPGQQLGWEEANREACMRNLNLLSAAARAFSFTPPVSNVAFDPETRQRLVLKYASQMHGCDFACPDGGRYALAEDGKRFVCSVHGSPALPRQADRPAASSPLAQLRDVTLTLARAPQGWRVVLTLTRSSVVRGP